MVYCGSLVKNNNMDELASVCHLLVDRTLPDGKVMFETFILSAHVSPLTFMLLAFTPYDFVTSLSFYPMPTF